jgi:hypothetical protein
MAGQADVQALVAKLRAAEAEGRVDDEIIGMLECRGRERISATYTNKAKAAAKDAKNDEETEWWARRSWGLSVGARLIWSSYSHEERIDVTTVPSDAWQTAPVGPGVQNYIRTKPFVEILRW